MRRRTDPVPGVLLWPIVLLVLLAMGAKPLARRMTGVEPPGFGVSAPIAKAAEPARPPAPRPKIKKGWDI